MHASTDFEPWSLLLGKYVTGSGTIRYEEWQTNREDRTQLNQLIETACHQDLTTLRSPQAKKAFWINLYNAMAMEIKLRQLDGVSLPENQWRGIFVYVGERRFSLDEIEHEQLRSEKDGRIHFALNCNARSCPPPQKKAWSADSVDEQLDRAAVEFLNSTQGARWDEKTKTLKLSKIFDWYRPDFGDSKSAMVNELLDYLPPETRSAIQAHELTEVQIAFSEYDWSLPSDLFPSEVDYWRERREEYDLGFQEADALRQQLLKRISATQDSVDQSTSIDLITTVVDALQKELAKKGGTESIAGFQLTRDRLTNQLESKTKLASESVFEPFKGKWYGVWDRTEVNHDWRPTRIAESPKATSQPGVFLCADQYAWIHNGFGWNYLVSADQKGLGNFVLGQVYYVDDKDRKRIVNRKPHVGFADLKAGDLSPTRLVWITEFEIFLEEVFPQTNREDDYYVITAIYHRLLSDEPTVSDMVTQAKYTRRNHDRPAFKKIRWNPPAPFAKN